RRAPARPPVWPDSTARPYREGLRRARSRNYLAPRPVHPPTGGRRRHGNRPFRRRGTPGPTSQLQLDNAQASGPWCLQGTHRNRLMTLSQDHPLQSDARLYQKLIESISDYAIFMLDPDGFVITWNRGAELIQGYTRDEVIGAHFS